MSYNIFFISDHHFAHSKPYDTFLRPDGKFLRHEFANAEEGDEAMIDRHNAVVKDNDRVYFVGDVCFHKRDLAKVGRMKGRKVLIKGNHDLLEPKDYLQYFDDIRGVHKFKGLIISHYPIHPGSLGKAKLCIHGHLHYRKILTDLGEEDPRYFNVSVECIDYTPISLTKLRSLNHEAKF
jgi:calcineurin-like phosphoesterase family protein